MQYTKLYSIVENVQVDHNHSHQKIYVIWVLSGRSDPSIHYSNLHRLCGEQCEEIYQIYV